MSQNSLVLPTSGLPGLTMIQDLNGAHDSMARWFSGPAAPTASGLGLVSLAGVPWHDTATNTLKVRDQADGAWITLGAFDEVAKSFTPAGLSSLGTAAYANAGTGAGNVLLLSAAAKLPVLDGSQLTNLPVTATPPVRNTVQAGVTDANGRAAFITTGSGLRPGLFATASPLVLTFAQGVSDYSETISADSAIFFPAVPASNLSFLHANRVGSGNVQGGSTLLPPQFGYSYDQTKQSLLHFDGQNVLDDYGNTWTSSNVAYSATSKFGAYCAQFTTASLSYFTITSKPNWNQPFTIDFWFKRGSLLDQNLMGDCDTSGNLPTLGLQMWFSSNVLKVGVCGGSTMYTITGPTVTDTASFHHVAVVRDVNSNFYLYWDGVAYGPVSLSGITVNQSAYSFCVGRVGQYSANYAQGYIDEFRISPCARWTAAFTPPTSAYNVSNAGESADWIDLSSGITVRSVSAASTVAGNNPVFTTVQRDYLGECVAGAAAITSVTSYAFNRRYVKEWISGLPSASTNTVISDNLGTEQKDVVIEAKCISSEYGYSVGTIINPALGTGSYSYQHSFGRTRNLSNFTSGSSSFVAMSLAAPGTFATLTNANWVWRARVTGVF